jgi:hypothetical protein
MDGIVALSTNILGGCSSMIKPDMITFSSIAEVPATNFEAQTELLPETQSRLGAIASMATEAVGNAFYGSRKIMALGGSIAAFGGVVPAVAHEADAGKLPSALTSANEHCAHQATKRPPVLKWGLEKGKKTTYTYEYAVNALDAACRGLGQRATTYRFEVKVEGHNWAAMDSQLHRGNNAIHKQGEFRIRPHFCDQPTYQPPYRYRINMRTDWNSKYGEKFSESVHHYTKSKTTCIDRPPAE